MEVDLLSPVALHEQVLLYGDGRIPQRPSLTGLPQTSRTAEAASKMASG